MTAEGLRRSTRTRKQVKNYAAEQAEDEICEKETKSSAKRKRKQPVTHFDGADTGRDLDLDDDAATTAPAKKSKKKDRKKKSGSDNDAANGDYDNDEGAAHVAPTKKSKTKTKTSDNSDGAHAREDGSVKKGLSLFFGDAKSTPEGSHWHADAAERRIASNKKKVKKLASGERETRLRSFVEEPSETYRKALSRANSQRLFVLSRERDIESDCHAGHEDCPRETVLIAGSTGNVYTVTITHTPTCSCPVGIFKGKGNETLCKHTLYILHNVLKVPDHLKQQNAFLTSELREIFSNAPAIPSETAADNIDDEADGTRKAIEGDCPICFIEFQEGEDIVWCRAACGNNIHKECFEQWASAKGAGVTCPYCRSAWEREAPKAPKAQKVDVASVTIPEARGKSGYRNVRDQLDYGV